MGAFIQFEVMNAKVKRLPWADVGERLYKIQHMLGFARRREFCNHFHVQESTASNWFNGRSRINHDDAKRICEEAGLTLDYLYYGETAGVPLERVRELNKIPA